MPSAARTGVENLRRAAPVFFAALGSIHKCEHFECLVIGDCRLARSKKLDNLFHEQTVAERRFFRALQDTSVAKHHGAVTAVWTYGAHRPDPAILPPPGDNVCSCRRRAGHFLASRTHKRV